MFHDEFYERNAKEMLDLIILKKQLKIVSALGEPTLNERYCLCHQPPGVRYIGCGGKTASNRAPKRRANVIILYPESTLSGDQVLTSHDRNAASPRK